MNFKDVDSNLCLNCGECCKIYIPVRGDERYFDFIKTIGYTVIQDTPNTGRIYLGYCKHLCTTNNMFRCTIYEKRPELCRDYNCLAWALCTNSKEKSETLQHAIEILRQQQ